MSYRRNGGMLRKRFFLLYPEIEIANFKQRDGDNDNAHSVCICVCSLCCTLLTYTLQRGILFLYSFLQGVWRCPISMNRTSLTLFLCL